MPARHIVVTGAGGFIGMALCRRLVADGATVLGLDVNPAAAARVSGCGAGFALADTTQPQTLAGAFSDAAGVVHTAALLGDRGRMADQIAVNVVGTRNVLDASEAAGVQRVVHLSSVATWGYDFASDITEASAPRVCGAAYVDTKSASHDLALRRGAAVVRPGDVYGPHSNPWTERPVAALRAGTFALPGDGGGVITPVYVDDLVECIIRALDHPDAGGKAVTAWDGVAIPARDFFAYYARMLGIAKIRTVPTPALALAARALELTARLRGTQPPVTREALRYISRRASYPNTAARDLLGWEPQVALDVGMQRTEAWLREAGLLGSTPA